MCNRFEHRYGECLAYRENGRSKKHHSKTRKGFIIKTNIASLINILLDKTKMDYDTLNRSVKNGQ